MSSQPRDMPIPDDVTALFVDAVENVAKVWGEPKVSNVGRPIVLPGLTVGSGWRARLSASWLIGGGYQLLAIDWYGPDRIHVEASSQTGRVGVFELWVKRLVADDLNLALTAIGLLPAGADGGEFASERGAP